MRLEYWVTFCDSFYDDDDDVYYPKGRRPREDEEGEESYEKQRQRPGRGAGALALGASRTLSYIHEENSKKQKWKKSVVPNEEGTEPIMMMWGASRRARR